MIDKYVRKRRLNDKGMSLVEVMVAITILSISLMAFFRTFIASAQYDARSKERQRQLNLSQGIMESFKAYSIEDMYRQFEGFDTFRVYGGTVAAYSQSSGASIDANNVFHRDDNNTYQFELNSLVYDNESYDVTIDVVPKGSEEADVKDYRKEVNSTNKYVDAVMLQTDDNINYVYNDILTRIGSSIDITMIAHIDPNKVSIISKVNTINLTGSPSNAKAEYTLKYEYHVDHLTYYTDLGVASELDGNFDVTITGDEVNAYKFFDNSSVSGSELRDVYFYFYPEYNAGSEQFIINNNIDNNLNFFLVEQKDPVLTGVAFKNAERDYSATVQVNGNSVVLRQNLTRNLAGATLNKSIHGGIGGNFSGNIANFENIKDKVDSFMLNDENNIPTISGIDKIPQVYDVIITVTGNGETYVLNGSTYSD